MKFNKKIMILMVFLFMPLVFVNAGEIKSLDIYLNVLPQQTQTKSNYLRFNTGNDSLHNFATVDNKNIETELVEVLDENGNDIGNDHEFALNEKVKILVSVLPDDPNTYLKNDATVKIHTADGVKTAQRRIATEEDKLLYTYEFDYTITNFYVRSVEVEHVGKSNDYDFDVNYGQEIILSGLALEDDNQVLDHYQIGETSYNEGDKVTITDLKTTVKVYYKDKTTYKLRFNVNGSAVQIHDEALDKDFDYINLTSEDLLKKYVKKVNVKAPDAYKKYVVNNWYLDPEFKKPVNDTIYMTKDTTLYGRYELGYYVNSTCEDNGVTSFCGSISKDGKSKYYFEEYIEKDEEKNIKLNAEPLNGYKFVGWYDSNNQLISTDAEYTFTLSKSSEFFEGLTKLEKDISAKFTLADNAKYVSFMNDNNADSSYNFPLSKYAVEEGSLVKDIGTVYKVGYKSNGWCKNSKTCTEAFNFDTPITEATIFYPKWEETNETVFEVFSYSLGKTFYVKQGETINVPEAPQYDGELFDSWAVSFKWASHTTYNFDFNTPVYVAMGIEPVYYNSFNLSFDTKGGNAIEAIKMSNGSHRPSLPTPIREGYTFNGWYVDSNLTTKYTDDYVFTGDTTFYARWTVNRYTVRFDTNGGNSIDPIMFNYGTTIPNGGFPENPKKEGYDFAGWYTDKEATKPFYETTLKGDITIYAGWKLAESTELTAPTISVTKGEQNTVVVTLDKYYRNQTYTLYKSTTTSKKKKWKKVGTFNSETLLATGLTFGQKTYFKVTAELDKKKVDSNTVDIKVMPDAAGELRIVSAGAKNIKLNWDKSGYTGYELQRSTKATSGFKKVTFLTKNSKISYNNTKLKNATTYYYRVRPYKTVKGKKIYGGFSNVVSATTGPATPKKPSIKAVNYNTITLNIKNAKTATYYEVSRSTKKNKGYTTIGATNELLFSDTVNTGTTYYYKVRACNAAGVCSGWTSQVNKKASLSKPTLSAGVTAVNIATDEQKREFVSELKDIIYSAETQFVKDSFDRENVVDRHVMNIGYYSLNGKSLVKNVKIDRNNNSEPFYKELKQTTSIEFYIEFNLAGKIIAFFATNNALKFEYTGSGLEKSQIQDYVKPLSNDRKLTLTVGASDGATGYVIQRSTKKNKGFKKITETTDLSVEDNGAKTGKTYWYRARAYRLVGTKRVYSGYTKPIKVTVK